MDPAKTNDANLKLIAAARWGSETQVQEALSSGGVNKNYKEKTGYGYTPLHSAVHSNTRVAWVLIQDAGVRVNAKTNLGHTPLHFGWRQCVDAMLLSGKLVLWNVEDKIGQTPLLSHARIVNDVNLSGLLKLGVERVKMEDIKTKDGFTVLHQVVERGSPFPNWYKEEHHSPQLRCKVVGLLLDELKRRASEKQKILDVLERRAAEEKKKGEYELERKTAKEKLSRKDEVERTAAKEKQKREDELERTKQSAKNEQNESQRQSGKSEQGGVKGSPDQKTDPEIKKTDTRETELQSVVVKFVNIPDKIGRTALHYIAEDGCVEILDKLLNWFTVQHVRSKVRVNVRDFYGFAPLHLAVLKGHTQMVERLLEQPQTNANRAVGVSSTDKIELMEWNDEHLEICRPNLSSRAPEKQNSIEGLTALHFAAMGGHTKIADLLLNWKGVTKRGDQSKTITVPVTAKDEKTLNSPFTYSIGNGHLEVATLLLRRIETENDGGDAFKKLLTLTRDKQTTDNLASEVLANNIQIAGITNTFERLLIVAANVNLPDVIRNVFNWKPDVNVNVEATWKDKRNSSNLRATPLHFAVLRGHVDIVRQLLSHKSLDVNAEDSNDRTPLQIAVEGALSRHASDGRKLSDEDKIKMKQIEKLLMERAEVKDLVERLYRDREVLINAVNALLVGAALIATVTFAGWLTPPLGLTPYVAPEPFPASPATSPHYTSLPHPTSVKVFWVSNSLSFILAIATVLLCAYAAMPRQHTYIREAVKFLRTILSVASMLFLFSVFFVLGAFASAGFAVLPSPHLNYKLSMILTVAIGGCFCSCCLGVLKCKLSMQSYEYSCGCLSSLCRTLSSLKKSSMGLSEDNSSRGGTIVDKDNEQPEKDGATLNKEIMKKWDDIIEKRGATDNADIEIGPDGEKMSLNRFDIQCIINGNDATDNVVKVYVDHCIPDLVRNDTWIVPVSLTSRLITRDDWTGAIESGDYDNAKSKKYHVFPFVFTQALRDIRKGIQPEFDPSHLSSGHWSLICWEPKQGFFDFNSLPELHKEELVAPFFRKLEIELNQATSKWAKATSKWAEPSCSPQEGNYECGYYMLLFLKHYLRNRDLRNRDLSTNFKTDDVKKLQKDISSMIFKAVQEEWSRTNPS